MLTRNRSMTTYNITQYLTRMCIADDVSGVRSVTDDDTYRRMTLRRASTASVSITRMRNNTCLSV